MAPRHSTTKAGSSSRGGPACSRPSSIDGGGVDLHRGSADRSPAGVPGAAVAWPGRSARRRPSSRARCWCSTRTAGRTPAALRRRLADPDDRPGTGAFIAADLLSRDGRDLTDLPFADRRARAAGGRHRWRPVPGQPRSARRGPDAGGGGRIDGHRRHLGTSARRVLAIRRRRRGLAARAGRGHDHRVRLGPCSCCSSVCRSTEALGVARRPVRRSRRPASRGQPPTTARWRAEAGPTASEYQGTGGHGTIVLSVSDRRNGAEAGAASHDTRVNAHRRHMIGAVATQSDGHRRPLRRVHSTEGSLISGLTATRTDVLSCTHQRRSVGAPLSQPGAATG